MQGKILLLQLIMIRTRMQPMYLFGWTLQINEWLIAIDEVIMDKLSFIVDLFWNM